MPIDDNSAPAETPAHVPLPPENPAAPPSPPSPTETAAAPRPVQSPSMGRIVHVVCAGGFRRPGLVTSVETRGVCSATVFLDPSKDCLFLGSPCPTTLPMSRLVFDGDADAPAGTWRWPPPCSDTFDVGA